MAVLNTSRLVRFANFARMACSLRSLRGVLGLPHFSRLTSRKGTARRATTPDPLIPHASLLIMGNHKVAPTPPLLIPHSSFLIPHSSLLTPHSSLLTPHSSFLTPHSSLLIPHSSLLTPHSSLLTPKTSLLTPHPSLLMMSIYAPVPLSFIAVLVALLVDQRLGGAGCALASGGVDGQVLDAGG